MRVPQTEDGWSCGRSSLAPDRVTDKTGVVWTLVDPVAERGNGNPIVCSACPCRPLAVAYKNPSGSYRCYRRLQEILPEPKRPAA